MELLHKIANDYHLREFLIGLAPAIISEFMALNPNCKYNGILEAIVAQLKKKPPG